MDNMDQAELPLRPRSHQIGDCAVHWLRQNLPPEWKSYDIGGNEYGIDVLVDVATNGVMTGPLVFLQVKGTDSAYASKGASVSVSTRTVNYWLQRPGPVILLKYFLKDDYAVWTCVKDYVANVLSKRVPNWRQQKTVTFRRTQAYDEESPQRFMFSAGSPAFSTEQQFNLLLNTYRPNLEFDVLEQLPQSIDAEQIAAMTSVFPPHVHDHLRSVLSLLPKVASRTLLSPSENDCLTCYLPVLVYWLGQQRAKLQRCRSNLKQLANALMQFRADWGELPAQETWQQDVAEYVRNGAIFYCPCEPEVRYGYNRKLCSGSQCGEPFPLLFDADSTGDVAPVRHLNGAVVVMSDGYSVWMPSVEALQAVYGAKLAEGLAGRA